MSSAMLPPAPPGAGWLHGPALRVVAAAAVVFNGFFPALWILLTSLKTETELLKVPITYWPEAATLANYELAFTAQPILRFMWNSFVVASLSTSPWISTSTPRSVTSDVRTTSLL